MRSPRFWEKAGGLAYALAPLGLAWSAGSVLRQTLTKPYRAAIPVICVGNLVVGGTGKTPVTLAIAEYLKKLGLKPHLLGRGYGGSAKGPTRVETDRHTAALVGDEALLLANAAPTWAGPDRAAAARAAAAGGADVLLLDDGFQNPGLEKDCSLVVVDGGYGFGNGYLVPAGPLREPVASGLRRARAVVLVGEDQTGVEGTLAGRLPVLRGWLEPEGLAALAGRRLFAFAGIGRPEKFFETLRGAGLDLAGTRAFGDHHPYRGAEVEALLEAAAALDAVPVTTAKDAVRLPADLQARVHAVPVRFRFEDMAALEALLRPALPGA
ncbi:MAG: tetraacyldisaccharide 4'-kinase [Alphaproteobacteria bacterium]|nr:tetraacyldisaccharide 4'-kinase [Alphaproteobacteria bacterium]